MKQKNQQEVHQRVGKLLREVRIARGLTQEEFAFQLGLSRNGCRKLEQGVHLPGFSLLIRLEVEYELDFRALYPYVVKMEEERRIQREEAEKKEREKYAAKWDSHRPLPSDQTEGL